MSDFLGGYDIQYRLESAPQGYHLECIGIDDRSSGRRSAM